MAGAFLEFAFAVQIFNGKFEAQLFGPRSAVGNTIQGATQDVVDLARSLIGRNTGHLFAGHHPENGSLAATGKVVPSVAGSGQATVASYLAVFDSNIALVHHNGAKAHPIAPHGRVMKRDFPLPATYLSPTGRFRAVKQVNHPGHAANPYLLDAAQMVGLQASGALLRGSALTPLFRAPRGFV